MHWHIRYLATYLSATSLPTYLATLDNLRFLLIGLAVLPMRCIDVKRILDIYNYKNLVGILL